MTDTPENNISDPADFTINPAFDRHPEEARLVGRILASFGEIEFMVCRVVGNAMGSEQTGLRAFYRMKMTSARIEVSTTLARPNFSSVGLTTEFDSAVIGTKHALKIRNQFAHCNWGDAALDKSAGLFFADIEKAVEGDGDINYAFKHVDVPLLERHFQLFAHLNDWWHYLEQEFVSRAAGRPPHSWPKPPVLDLPPLHNPEELHIPPWISEGLKALHLERALAKKDRRQVPTPAKLAQDRLRAEKRARQEAQRQSSRNGGAKQNSSPDPNEPDRE